MSKEQFATEKQRHRQAKETARLQLALLEKESAALAVENQAQESFLQEAGALRRFDGVTELAQAPS